MSNLSSKNLGLVGSFCWNNFSIALMREVIRFAEILLLLKAMEIVYICLVFLTILAIISTSN